MFFQKNFHNFMFVLTVSMLLAETLCQPTEYQDYGPHGEMREKRVFHHFVNWFGQHVG
ncbi:hypothetical protein Ocin01_17694 [Orchesella cincta]|uniref:Uncharacterized protein n=1 Tax=Orchesella cincta TaxID=48709 RepID=A0A1D2M7P6_ORCCI|nr:hypothetical protein Ocin01_17694 [Orchesella cincta]